MPADSTDDLGAQRAKRVRIVECDNRLAACREGHHPPWNFPVVAIRHRTVRINASKAYGPMPMTISSYDGKEWVNRPRTVGFRPTVIMPSFATEPEVSVKNSS